MLQTLSAIMWIRVGLLYVKQHAVEGTSTAAAATAIAEDCHPPFASDEVW